MAEDNTKTLFTFFNTPQFKPLSVKDSTAIVKELQSYFPKARIMAMDDKYKIYSYDDLNTLILINTIIQKPWNWNSSDCDKYARSLWTLAGQVLGNSPFAFVIVPSHALNLMRDNKGNWYWIDNKNGKYETFPMGYGITKGYTPSLILV
jgi:hypothetical protein